MSDELKRVGGRIVDGTWPAGDPRRAFVEGAKWWQYKTTGFTAFPSEVDVMAEEAEVRLKRGDWPDPDKDRELFETEWTDEQLDELVAELGRYGCDCGAPRLDCEVCGVAGSAIDAIRFLRSRCVKEKENEV